MTYPGDGQTGWGGQSGQGDWGQQRPQQGYGGSFGEQGYTGFGEQPQQQPGYGGAFGEQGYGASYGGLGVFSGGDEPPPRKGRGKLWLIVGLVVLLVVGGGITAFVLTRPDDSRNVANSSTNPPTSTSTSASEEPGPSCEATVEDWNCLPVPDLSFSYEVPKSWSPSPASAPVDGLPDVKLTGLTVYGVYSCGGKDYNRGSTGGVIVEPKGELAAVAKDFAQRLGNQYYSSAPTHNVSVGQAKSLTIPNGDDADIQGVQVDATITTTGNQCLATKGMVKILVLKGTNGFHVFMANGDLEGGPGNPKPALEADLQQMVDSVKPFNR